MENSSERIEIKSIPKDWKVAKLGDIAEVKGGKRLPKGHSLLDTPTRFPYISIAGTIGLAGIIPPELNGANLTENAAKLCNLRNVDKKFLAYILNSEIAKPQISALIGKATQRKLALFRIEKINIPLPPLLEQRRIAEILSAADRKLELERRRKEKLERVKQGLMNDLLTGRKRIKINV